MSGETTADRRLHPSSIWLSLIRRQLSPLLVPAAVYVLANIGSRDGVVRILKFAPLALLVLIGLSIATAFSYLSWRKFRYGVGEREIVIESGVFNHVRRSIPLARVQDVNIEQGPVQRLFGVAKVKIETGGGEKDEGVLDSITLKEAEALRQSLKAGHPAPASKRGKTEFATPEAVPIFTLGPARLMLASLFSFSLVYFAAAYAVLETLGDLHLFSFRTLVTAAQGAGPMIWFESLLLVLALGVIVGAGRTVLRDYGFTLWKDGRRFRRERGLLTRSQVVVPIPRIQLATVRTSPIRRLFGWFEVTVQTLGGAIDDVSGRQSIAPFATAEEAGKVLAETGRLPLPADGSLLRVSSRRLWKKLAPLVIPILAVMIVSAFFPLAALLFVAIAIVAGLTALEWDHYRYGVSENLLYVRDGFLNQRLWIVPPSSAQTITLRRSLLQKWLGIASVVIDTAGARATEPLVVQDLREDRARELIDFLRAGARPATPSPRRRRGKARSAPP